MMSLSIARPVPQKERRQTVVFFGLGAVLVLAVPLLALLNGGHYPNPLSWFLLVSGFLLVLWSGQRLRSPEWGLHDWKRQPDALDERQRMRALLAVAQTQNISVTVLTVVCGGFLVLSDFSRGADTKYMIMVLWFIVNLMTMLPTLILAWTEADDHDL